jgi:hypothetical protein
MYIHIPDVNQLASSNRLPCLAEPTLRDENSDEQVQMSDTGLVKFQYGYEIDALSTTAGKIHTHFPPTLAKVDFG